MKRSNLTLTSLLILALFTSSCSNLMPVPSIQQAAPTIPHFPTLPPTWTPVPTDTPAPPTVTNTPEPSATPVPETLTVQPLVGELPTSVSPSIPVPLYITPLPDAPDLTGWHEIKSETASFWLPETFVVADLGGFGDLMELMMVGFTQGMLEAFSARVTVEPGAPAPTALSVEEMQAAFNIDLLMAVDETLQAAVFLSGEPSQPGTTLDSQIASAIDNIEGSPEIVSYEVYIGGQYETARAVVQSWNIESGAQVKQLIYVFLRGERAWTISYQSEPSKFDELLPIFERSAQTFVTLP